VVDAVTICTRVPHNFETCLRPKYAWRVRNLKKIGTVYVLAKNLVRYEYRPSSGRVWCRFNGPKIVHGNNWTLLHPADWPSVVQSVWEDLFQTFLWIPPHPSQWIVSHIEYPQHMRVPSAEKELWLRLLADLRIPYLFARTDFTDRGSTYQENGSRQVIIYDKWKQVKRRERLDVPELEDVLRVELRFRNTKALQRQMKNWGGKVIQATLENATSPEWVAHVQEELRRMVDEIATAPTLDEAKRVMEHSNWGKAKIQHHLNWMLEVTEKGAAAVFAESKDAYYRRRRALAGIGLPIMLSIGLTPPIWIEPQQSVASCRVA
jgi:hypothetical protein